MTQRNLKPQKLYRLMLATVGLLIASWLQCSLGFCDGFKTPIFPDHFWNKNTRNTDIHLISPHQMSTEQLILNAETIRRSSDNMNQRLLNNLWLTMEQSKHYEGAKAVGDLLPWGLLSYRRGLTKTEINDPFNTFLGSTLEDALITHFHSYDLEVTSKSVALNITIGFH